MQEHRAAAAGNPRTRVVVDLDYEIVEVVLAPQAVAALAAAETNRLIVMTIGRVFAPGVLGADRPDRQEGLRPDVTIGAPPQPARVKDAERGAAVALALVGLDAATSERDRNGPAIGREPPPAGVTCSRGNANHRQW